MLNIEKSGLHVLQVGKKDVILQTHFQVNNIENYR